MPTRLPFNFAERTDRELGLEDVVFQALGGASTCWSSIEDAGVFDSNRAKEIGDLLVEWLRKHPESIYETPDESQDISRKLHSTTRADVWAEEFCKLFTIQRRGSDDRPEVSGISDDDQGLMIGWFANAIETGRDAGRST